MLDASEAIGEPMIIVDKSGLRGTVVDLEQLPFMNDSQLLVDFENGQRVLVPREMLTHQEEEQYYLPVSVQELSSELPGSDQKVVLNTVDGLSLMPNTQLQVIPVLEESVSVEKRTRDVGIIEIRKTVHERTQIVDEPLKSERVEIERFAINRIVDEPVPIRNEGDTTIISLLEEVLVIEKRLLLREEVHIKKIYTEVHEPQEVLLREERVEVMRTSDTDQG